MNVVDSNGNALADGDSVLVIKDLKAKERRVSVGAKKNAALICAASVSRI